MLKPQSIQRNIGEIEMTEAFEQGWSARKFKEQFPELPEDVAENLDKLNYSITYLLLQGLITDGEKEKIRQKRFPRIVAKAVVNARKVNQ